MALKRTLWAVSALAAGLALFLAASTFHRSADVAASALEFTPPTYGDLLRDPDRVLHDIALLESSSSPDAGLARFVRAYYLLGERRADEALADLAHPSVEASAVGRFARLLRAEALLLEGRYDEIAPLAYEETTFPAARRLLFTLAVDALLMAGDPEAAHRAVLDAGFTGRSRARWLAATAEEYLARGCIEEGLALARETLASHAATDAARRMEKFLDDPAFTATLTDAFWRARAQSFLDASAYTKASAALARLRTKTPLDRENEGVALYHRGLYAESLKALASLDTPRAHFHRAECLRRLRNPTARLTALERAFSSQPRDAWWGRAARALAAERRTAGLRDDERRIHATVAASGAHAEDRKEALWTLAWDALLAGENAAALAWLADYRGLPGLHWEEALRAEFWRARALEQLGGEGEAREIYRALAAEFPDHFYGVRSRMRVGDAPSAADTPGMFFATREAAPVDSFDNLLTAARSAEALVRVGLPEEARLWLDLLLDEGADDDPGLWLARAHLEARAGDFRGALRAFHNAVGRGGATLRMLHERLSDEAFRAMYPLYYWDEIQEHAARRGLDPLLVAAVIHQESTFNPRAVSRAGARGLMQIMPATGREIARGRKHPYAVSNLHDPARNIDYGTQYLAGLLDRFGGNVEAALAGYNGGPNRVPRWKNAVPEGDIEMFVENIPLGETRRYVKRVTMHYERYRRLYAPEERRDAGAPPEPAPVMPDIAEPQILSFDAMPLLDLMDDALALPPAS